MTSRIQTFPAPGGMVRARLDGSVLTAELIRALPVRAVQWPESAQVIPHLSVTTGRTYTWKQTVTGAPVTGPAAGEWIGTGPAGRLVLLAATSPGPEDWAAGLPHLAYEKAPYFPSRKVEVDPVRGLTFTN